MYGPRNLALIFPPHTKVHCLLISNSVQLHQCIHQALHLWPVKLYTSTYNALVCFIYMKRKMNSGKACINNGHGRHYPLHSSFEEYGVFPPFFIFSRASLPSLVRHFSTLNLWLYKVKTYHIANMFQSPCMHLILFYDCDNNQ